jgi:hypothetical protein
MDQDSNLSFTPIAHPDERVHRVGFDLTDPYVEQCWGAVIGPSATLLLRRLPELWVERVPAAIGASDLSRSLGLGVGVGDRSRLTNTLDRLVRFGLARPSPEGAGLDVFRQVPPLAPRQLDRLPSWTRHAHERLFGPHLEEIGDAARHQASIASITARLDRIQNAPARSAQGTGPRGQALGR